MYELERETRGGRRAVVRVPDEARYEPLADEDVMLPAQFEVVFWPEEDGRAVHVASFAVIDGRPVCMGAGAQMPTPDTRPVATADLRAVSVDAMLAHASDVLAAKRTTPDAFGWAIGPDVTGTVARSVRKATKRRMTDAFLRDVAKVYEANIEGTPTEAVRQAFDVSIRTASLYVNRAHEAGHIKALKTKGGR